jgi:hypothetical protein
MNHSINFEGDWALHGIMSDLGVNYALSPFHRIGFEIDDAGIQTLAERYHDRRAALCRPSTMARLRRMRTPAVGSGIPVVSAIQP